MRNRFRSWAIFMAIVSCLVMMLVVPGLAHRSHPQVAMRTLAAVEAAGNQEASAAPT